MLFSSVTFIWVFLPIVFIGCLILPPKFQNIFLLLASLLFYAWGEPKYVFLMIISIMMNWALGIIIDKVKGNVGWSKCVLVIAVLLNLAIIGYFKYFNFMIAPILGLEKRNIELPIGISFFTFQALSYVIDLYKKEYKVQKNPLKLALYISFFPQLIAGPIVKYKDINAQIDNRQITDEKVALGFRRFVYGLGKKVIISNILAECVDNIHALNMANVSTALAWIAALFYTMQIYYDFSGYSDMAIGLGKMFGFDFMENFNYPYVSTSIREFWGRWHISLSTWFKEYVYIPLGGNKKGMLATYRNIGIVFLLTGLWHGASWNFVLWGFYNAVFQWIERAGVDKFIKKHKLLSHMYLLVVVMFGWVLFRADNLIIALKMLMRMLMPWRYWTRGIEVMDVVTLKMAAVFIVALIGCGWLQHIYEKIKGKFQWKNSFCEIIWCAMVFVTCMYMLAANTYNPFIYFRF